MSVSLKLAKVLIENKTFGLAYNVSVSVMRGQTPEVTKEIELCTFKEHNAISDKDEFEDYTTCISNVPFPTPGRILQSEDKLVKVTKIASLVVNNSLVLRLKLLQHYHCLFYL